MNDKPTAWRTYFLNVVSGMLIGWFLYPDESMAAMICATWMLVSTFFLTYYKRL